MIVALIAAVAKNRVIGNQGKLPWRIPEDLKFFKATTQGHAIIMGRKSFDSLGRPLPNRQNIVITRNPAWRHDGVTVASSLKDALSKVSGEFAKQSTVFITGGGEIYRQAFEQGLADRVYLTEIDEDFDGDAFFPEFDRSKYTVKTLQTALEPHPYSIRVYSK